MKPSLIAIAICVASFSLPSTTYAQFPPPFPEVHLADIPAEVADGSVYHICGTVTGIADGSTVYISVQNTWMNFGGSAGNYSVSTTAIVSGGAFCTTASFTFYGAGFYEVFAMSSVASDQETGTVAAP